MGVTVFMPQTVTKDIMKRLTEYGDMFSLTAKDKRIARIAEKDLEWINFEIDNPLPDFYLRELYDKDVYMMAWKILDTETRPVEEVLHEFTNYLSKPQPIANDLSDPPISMPPILKPYPIMVDDEELERFKAMENEDDAFVRERIQSMLVHREAAGVKDGEEGESKQNEEVVVEEPAVVEEPEVDEMGEEETEAEQEPDEGIAIEDSDHDPDANDDESVRFEENTVEEEEEVEADAETETEKSPRTNKVFMLPVWTPYNKVAQAALVYLYFRNVSVIFFQFYCFISKCLFLCLILSSKPTTFWGQIQFPIRHTLPLCSMLTNVMSSWN